VSPRRAELGAIARLAVPAALTQLATVLMGIVDTLMVARLGTEALAAATLGAVWVFGTFVVGMGVLFGLDPIVSQAHGAGDQRRVGLALQRGLVLSVLLALPVGLLWAATGPALRLAGQLPELAELAHRYARVQIWSAAPGLAFVALRQYLSGRGIMAPALWVMVAGNVVNVVLNWALIFGHLGFAPRGLIGAGIATALSRAFLLVALAALVAGRRLHHGGWTGWSADAVTRHGLLEVLRYGGPVGAQFGLEVWGFHVVTFLAGKLGAVPLAAHSIALHLASFTFNAPLGVSFAASTRVGNLTGAGDLAGRRRAAGLSLAVGASVMALAALAFLLLRAELPRLWAPAPDVLALAAAVLPIAAAFQVFDGTQVVGCGVLRGVGDTRPAALYNLVGYYLLGLPAGWLLAFRLGMGLQGLWWGLTLGLLTVATLLTLRIHRRL
jgi:MATE family multidrug resistance protein